MDHVRVSWREIRDTLHLVFQWISIAVLFFKGWCLFCLFFECVHRFHIISVDMLGSRCFLFQTAESGSRGLCSCWMF